MLRENHAEHAFRWLKEGEVTGEANLSGGVLPAQPFRIPCHSNDPVFPAPIRGSALIVSGLSGRAVVISTEEGGGSGL